MPSRPIKQAKALVLHTFAKVALALQEFSHSQDSIEPLRKT